MRKQILSLVGILSLVVVAVYFLAVGVVKVTDLSAAIAFVLVAGMVALATYGFTDWFETLFGIKAKVEPTAPVSQAVPTPDREKRDFRNGVAVEVHSLLMMFVDPLQHWHIDHPSWSGKADESKASILGKEDYLVLRSLYDAIDERNRYFASRQGFDLGTLDPLNRRCVETLSRAYGEVTWLKTEPDTDTLLSRARKNVGLPKSSVETTKAQTTPEIATKLPTPQPELTIPISELKSTGEVKEVEVRFPDGETVRKHRVCFYYATVRAKGQRTVENVFAYLDGNPLKIVPRTGKPSFGIDYDRLSVKKFDEAGPQEFVYALLGEREKTKDRIRYLHPGPGQDFVLFFGVEGLKDFFIVGNTFLWYNPRTGLCGLHRDDGTGTLKLGLRLDGQDAIGCTVMFEVAFRKWDSFSVTAERLPQQV
jgi:hypothetical protein